jgi:hypothetical protein
MFIHVRMACTWESYSFNSHSYEVYMICSFHLFVCCGSHIWWRWLHCCPCIIVYLHLIAWLTLVYFYSCRSLGHINCFLYYFNREVYIRFPFIILIISYLYYYWCLLYIEMPIKVLLYVIYHIFAYRVLYHHHEQQQKKRRIQYIGIFNILEKCKLYNN